MEINDLLGIGIVGVVASLIIEAITRLSATKPLTGKAIAIAVSLLLAVGYYFVRQTEWYVAFLGILGMASTVYALFFTKNS